MKNMKVLWGALTVLALMSACAKDKNLDDFKAEQYQRDFAQLQLANGTYRGLLVSKKDGSSLGALEVVYEAKTSVVNSTDQTKASSRPILTSNINFVGATRMSIVATTASYDPQSGNIQSEVAVTRTTGATSVILNGNLDKGSGVISGSLEAQGYPADGATFVLIRDGQSLEQINSQHKIVAKPILTGDNYVGTTTFNDKHNTVKNVNMILLKPETTSADDFLTLVSPVNPITVTLNYGESAQIQFSGANWDQQKVQSKLIGTAQLGCSTTSPSCTSTLTPTQMTINCDFDSRSKAFTCQHILAGSTVAAVTNVKKAPEGAPTEPKDSSKSRDSILRVYKGDAEFVVGKKQRIAFNFSYDSRNRLQEITDLFVPTSEKIVRVAVILIGTDPETHKDRTQASLPSFNTTKWDQLNLTLDGEQTGSTTGSSVPLTVDIHCTDFSVDDPKYDFQCLYSSSLAPGDVTLHLHAN